MPAVLREMAERVVANDGWLEPPTIRGAPDIPRATCVIRYWNREFVQPCWAVCYGLSEFGRYLADPAVGDMTILWSRPSARDGIDVLMTAAGRRETGT